MKAPEPLPPIGGTVLMTVAVLGVLSCRDVRTLRHRLPVPATRPVEESTA